MKIAVITPCYHPLTRGNGVTVRRIEINLAACGCEVEVYALDAMTAEEIHKKVRAFDPDIIHAFHANVGGRTARVIAGIINKPYIITLTGSDIYEALEDARREETVLALKKAAAVVAFHKSIKTRVVESVPSLAGTTMIIPQGVQVPGDCYPHHDDFRPSSGDRVILLPAGLRPVKNVSYPLPLLSKLYEEGIGLYFVLIGPIINCGYAAEVLAEQENYPFAHYFGEVGHNAIGWFYQQADVVLNTSSFEGGMANTVLEAMIMAKPVLASNIEGNRSVVRDGVNGFLYRGDSDFLEKLERLLAEDKLRQRVGKSAQNYVLENFRAEKEAAAYLRLYREISGISCNENHASASMG